MNCGRNRSEGLVLEERYAYYRRCQTVRKNGVQCKAPALKGERICCKHRLQEEMRERWERQRAALRLPRRFEHPRQVLEALDRAGQALLEGRVDEKLAGRIIWELSMELWRFLPRMNADGRGCSKAILNAAGLSRGESVSARHRPVENGLMIWGDEPATMHVNSSYGD